MSLEKIRAATPQQFRDTFTHGSGIDVLTDLEARFLAPDPFAADPQRTAYNCGTAAVVRYILQQMISEEEP